MRVAVFKRMPAWAAYPLHPFARILRAKGVRHAQLFFHEERRLPIPPAIDSFLYGLVGPPAQSYRSMSDDAVLETLAHGDFDVIFPDGATFISSAIRRHAKIGVLHFHQARLPEVRGLCSVEWSVLSGVAPGVTLTFCEAGMDLGDNLLIDEVKPGATSIAEVKKRCHALGWDQIRRFCSEPDAVLEKRSSQTPEEGRTFYSMVQPMRDLVELRLSGREADRARAQAGFRALRASLPGESAAAPGADASALALSEVPGALKMSATYEKMDRDDRLLGMLHFLIKRDRLDAEIAGPVVGAVGRRVEAGFAEDIDRLRFFNELAQLVACGEPGRRLVAHPPVRTFLDETAGDLAK